MADKRRQPVVQGGMWTSAKASYSPQTQKLLKEMMQESKLNNFQQRQLGKAVSGGSSLPSSCHPFTSDKKNLTSSPKQPSRTPDASDLGSALRSRDQIKMSGAYEVDQYQPPPQTKFRGFYEKDKERLANMMAYGEEIPPPSLSKAVQKHYPPEKPEVDRFDELLEEIEERRTFLNEMESIGKGGEYKGIIETEISRLIRDLEVIDKQRTEQLQRRIEAEDRKKKQKKDDMPKS